MIHKIIVVKTVYTFALLFCHTTNKMRVNLHTISTSKQISLIQMQCEHLPCLPCYKMLQYKIEVFCTIAVHNLGRPFEVTKFEKTHCQKTYGMDKDSVMLS